MVPRKGKTTAQSGAAAPGNSAASRSCVQTTSDAPGGKPDAIVNLATSEGIQLVKGQWRYSDARIVEVDHRAPGPDLKASGTPVRTHDIVPRAGAADFDDSQWEAIDGSTLDRRRAAGSRAGRGRGA